MPKKDDLVPKVFGIPTLQQIEDAAYNGLMRAWREILADIDSRKISLTVEKR